MQTGHKMGIKPHRSEAGYTLVTGASQGLGKALAEECARRGMDLVLVALPSSGLSRVAASIALRYGVGVRHLELDLATPPSPRRLEGWIARNRIPISGLVNNAGVGYNRRFEDSTLRENEACILLNNLALVQITRLLLPDLMRHPKAFVLNVASLAAYFPLPFMPVYASSKAFILSFSLALRAELRDSSVSVSVLCPNGIRTNQACRAKIDRAGMIGKVTCFDADQVAAHAMERTLAGAAVIVPGWINRMIAAAGRFAPPAIIYGVASRFWGGALPTQGYGVRPASESAPSTEVWP